MSNTRQFREAAAAGDTSQYIRDMVHNDGVRANLCGRGVRTTLQALGIPCLTPGESGRQDGYRWGEILSDPRMQAQGWEEVDWKQMGWSPENSPPGVVWVYGHNEPRPNPEADSTGRAWGHVEIALEDGYVAGGFANNPGGSVRHNTPRAFVNPKLTELFQAEGAVPEDYARASVDRAVETVAEETRRRDGEDAERVYRDNIQRDVNQIDFSGVTLMDLLKMLVNILSGQPIDAPTLFRDHNGSGPEPTPESDTPAPTGQDQPDAAAPEAPSGAEGDAPAGDNTGGEPDPPVVSPSDAIPLGR